MIAGFNPADMYGGDHIRRGVITLPGVFTGSGEFSIHKAFASRPGAVLRGVRPLGAALGALMTPEASLKVRRATIQRIFDEGRRRVRAWEAANTK